jgi:hypothetical protein
VTDKNLRARVEALTNGIAYAMARAPVPTATTTAREYAASLAPLVIESGFLDQPAPPDTALREALDAAVESAMRDLSGTNEELRTVEEAFQVGVGAGIAKMRRAVEALHDRYEETGMMTGHSAAWDMKDLLRLAATAPTPPDGLDAAWREAEAALPEGWWIEKVYLRERGTYLETYSAWARRPDSDGGLRGDGATPTAALRSLADAFRAAAPPEPAP